MCLLILVTPRDLGPNPGISKFRFVLAGSEPSDGMPEGDTRRKKSKYKNVYNEANQSNEISLYKYLFDHMASTRRFSYYCHRI